MTFEKFKDLLHRQKKKSEKEHLPFLDIHSHDKDNYLGWKDIIDNSDDIWQKALDNKTNGKKILIASLSGGFSHRPFAAVDSLLSVALTLRGADVELLCCDHALPACLKAEYFTLKPQIIDTGRLSSTLCKGCYFDVRSLFKPLQLPSHSISNLASIQEQQEAVQIAKKIRLSKIRNFKIDTIPIGEHAYAGAVRYYAAVNITTESLGANILRKYLEAAIISYYAIKNLLGTKKYDSMCVNHGFYVPHGIISEVCKEYGVTVINWHPSYRLNTFMFQHEGMHSKILCHESTSDWENMNWGIKSEKKIMDYLEEKKYGKTNDLVYYQKKEGISNFLEFAKHNKIDLKIPIVGLLTNVVWDAELFYDQRTFRSMLTWIKKTINYFKKRNDLQLLVRIHPGEAHDNSTRQFVLEEINKMFRKIPKNVFIIGPSVPINTYEAMGYCNSAIVYATTMGIELPPTGIPVIVAGESWVRNKKITFDPSTEQEYFKLLDQMPFSSSLSQDLVERAKKYAFHMYFRRMIPISCLKKRSDYMLYDLTITKLQDLLPGIDLGLDIICEGIMNKEKPFVYPAEAEFKP